MTTTVEPRDVEPTTPDRPAPPSTNVAWIRSRTAKLSVVGAFLIFALINAIAGSSGIWTPDEAVTHRQVLLLRDGQWSQPLTEPALNPDGIFEALSPVSVGDSGQFAPYAKHPLFPLLATAGDMVGGRFGRFLIPAIGSVVAAAVIAVGADRRRAGSGTLTFWMMMIGTPVLFHGAVLWGHSLAMASSAIVSLALLKHLEPVDPDPDPGQAERGASRLAGAVGNTPVLSPVRRIAIVGAAIAFAVMLRSEAAIFFVLGGCVVAATGAMLRRRSTILLGLGALGVALVAFVLDGMWRVSILGPSPAATLSVPDVELFDIQVRTTLLTLWTFGLEPGFAGLRRLGAICILISAASLGRNSLLGRSEIAFFGGALYVVSVLTHSTVAVAIAAPAVFVGLIFVHRVDLFMKIAGATAILAFGAVLMTSWANGGGGDWGGRYHAMSLAPLGMIAGASLWDAWNDERRRFVIATGIASLALGFGMAEDVVNHRHNSTEIAVEIEAQIEATAQEGDLVLVTDGRLTRLLGDFGVQDRYRLLQIGSSLEQIEPQIAGENIVFVDWLLPYETPDSWELLAETDEVQRFRVPG